MTWKAWLVAAGPPIRPAIKIFDAAAKERLHLDRDLWRQDTSFGTEHATEAHPAITLECGSESRPIDRDRIFSSLIRLRHDCREKALAVTACDDGRHLRLRRKVMMDACALDAGLGRETAKAKSRVPAFADVRFGEIH